MKALLIGANGQLGSDLVKALASVDLVPLTHKDVDICEPVGLHETVRRHAPDVVLNMAAYHKVLKDRVSHRIDKTKLLTQFLEPQNFSLLKWGDYVE